MIASRKIRVGVVGLRFGAAFVPIYQRHPDVELAAICDRDRKLLDECGDRCGVPAGRRRGDHAELLHDPGIDAIHFLTPIPFHAEHSIACLEAGKHVACAVPMATSVEACAAIARAQRASGKNYMMMETGRYTREVLFVRHLIDSGEFGRVQFLRAAHHQDMRHWPGYWQGLPPMHYATHCVGPMLGLAGKLADKVSCIGSGRIADELAIKYGSPFAVESAHLKLAGSDIGCEMTRSLFETAREYVESFDAYGSKRSFEWEQTLKGKPVVFTGENPAAVDIPDYADRLPAEIREFTKGGHGGSHPHLAHEFIRSIAEGRKAQIDEVVSANWTCAGILAHESAMRGGAWLDLPAFARN